MDQSELAQLWEHRFRRMNRDPATEGFHDLLLAGRARASEMEMLDCPELSNGTPRDMLSATLRRTLRVTSRGNSSKILVFRGEVTLYTFHSRREEEARPCSLQSLVSYESRTWRPTGPLIRLLEGLATRGLHARQDGIGTDHWLPLLTCFANGWAQRLIAQIRWGAGTNEGRPDPEVENRLQHDVETDKQARYAFSAALKSMVEGITPPEDWPAETSGIVMAWIEPGAEDPRVHWLNDKGKTIVSEPLSKMLCRVEAEERIDFHLRQFQRFRDALEEKRAAHWSLLRRTCPQLEAAVTHVCQRKGASKYTLFSGGKVHGLPVQVQLSFPSTINGTNSSVQLVATRACEEFVLQNSAGSLFYFGPSQVVAQIDFHPGQRTWSLQAPRIRIPANCQNWTHPYTGTLHPDGLATAKEFSADCREPIVAPSKIGSRLVRNRSEVCPLAMTGDICLAGQGELQGSLTRRIQESIAQGGLDLFPAIWSLWDFIAMGLTRGHEKNQSRPRVPLAKTEMLHFVERPRDLMRTPLSQRVYAYNRARPVRLG